MVKLGEQSKQLESLISSAYDYGAYKAKAIDPQIIVIENRAQVRCLIPRCTSYNKSLTCPPNTPSPEEVRKIVSEYSAAIMIQVKGSEEEDGKTDDMKKDYNWVYPSVYNLHKIIHEIEKQAFDMGFYLALGLGGGDCRWCEMLSDDSCSKSLHANAGNCKGVKTGKCMEEYRARPALEAMSVNVLKTAENAGLPFYFTGKDQRFVIWNGILLVD